MKQISGLVQFIVGFLLGIFVLAAGATALSYFLFAKMSANPPKPLFAEEKTNSTPALILKKAVSPVEKKVESTTVKTQEKSEEKKVAESPKSEASPSPSLSPSPDTKAQEKEKEKLPPGASKGKVTWASGLSIRAEASSESSRIGGVDYNTEIILLEKSADGKWQKIRLSDGQEGWVKAGNVDKNN